MNQFEQFTKEQDEWIISNYWNYSIKNLTDIFNKKFNANRSYEVVKQHCRETLKLSHKFTNEMKQFLVDNYYSCSRKELTDLFNKHFNQNRSEQTLRTILNRLGHTFTENKERISSLHKGNAKYPEGRIVKRKNGYWQIKAKGSHYVGLAKYIYEKENGPIPSSSIVIFLDRDHDNFDINNLYCVSGKVHREMLKKQWYSTNPDITLTAIKTCELMYALKEVKHGN